MSKDIYWHLPGLFYFRFLNQVLLNCMRDYPECFRDGYKIGSIYGTVPGAIWNGGRAVFGITPKADIEATIKMYNSYGVPVRFTWTNSLLEEVHTFDTYCNMIMQVADGGFNQVLVNRPALEAHIRKNYPKYPVISSTTKRILDLSDIEAELAKDYALVVLDYDYNHNLSVIDRLSPHADRIEILVNEICYPNCPKRADHYRVESKAQLEFDLRNPYECPNKSTKQTFAESMKRPAFLSNEQIAAYAEKGYVNYKIVGRGLPLQFVLDSYMYFLVKEEKQTFIREKILRILASAAPKKK